MSGIVDQLIEMGFKKERAELAVSKTGANDLQVAMDWILSHDEEDSVAQPSEVQSSDVNDSSSTETKTTTETAKSIKCDDCGKLFKDTTDAEVHASKTEHANFSESTEEKQALTEDEKKEQLAKIEEKLKQRRLEREAKEKLDELEREKNRIRSGKDILEAKKRHEEMEMKKIVEQRKREKEEERLARQRVKEQIEQDKLARKAKLTGQPIETPAPVPQSVSVVARPAANYSEVKLQIRLTDGSSLTQTFGAKEPLSAVRLFIEMNRKDAVTPFQLMTSFPKKIFGVEDYDKPLETLGLAPSAVLIVSKSM